MQTWMNSAPYLATSLYLPSKNHTPDPNLNASWVNGVLTQGWSLIPIWVGAQSPCACKPNSGTYPDCKLFTTLISTTTPNSDGESEAKAAEKQAASLGVSGVIIYKDIENYNPASVLGNGVTCATIVNAYLSGWDTQLHSDGYSAGAYGNPTPVANWSANVSPLPDDIWVAQANNQVTVWNVGTKYGMTDSMWPNDQRIHQFDIGPPHTESWGGTPAFTTDNDIVNAKVVNPNAIAKTYTYSTPANISCPGAINTYPAAINDMSNGAFINGPGQTGTVVGMVQYSIGSPNYAFQNIGGTCTTFSVLGSTIAEATGINNLGQIVGYFEGTDGRYHGFFQDVGKSPVQIDYSYNGQTATATYLYGINDAGQMVGYAYSPSTFYFQSFMYYGGQFNPMGYTGNFEYNQARAINGSAVVTGIYYYEPFYEDFTLAEVPSTATPPSWSGPVVAITPGGSANTQALGIDANNELAGYYTSTACNDTSYQCGFMWTGGFLLIILQYGATDNVATGLNDFAQVVGAYTDSTTQYSNGLVWTHQ